MTIAASPGTVPIDYGQVSSLGTLCSILQKELPGGVSYDQVLHPGCESTGGGTKVVPTNWCRHGRSCLGELIVLKFPPGELLHQLVKYFAVKVAQS